MRVLLSVRVDLVITDAMMPNLNGYELSRFVKSSPTLQHLPVVLLSALDPRNATSETDQIDAFLEKPVSPDDLLSCIRQFVNHPAK